MGLIGINPVANEPRQPKMSTLEQIALGVDMATKILGTGIAGYKAYNDRNDKTLDDALKMSQIQANIAQTRANTQLKERELAKPALTAGQEEVDKKFANEYSEFNLAGGYSGIQKNLDQLNLAKQRLESGTNISGPLVGLQPDSVRKITNPESASVQRDIEDAIQSTLRATLGPQFTEKEGTRILRNAFDPMLSESENARRVEGIVKSLDRIAKSKQNAADYYEAHGTLKGYRGQTSFGLSDFGLTKSQAPQANDNQGSGPKIGTIEDGHRFKGGNPADPNNWEIVR